MQARGFKAPIYLAKPMSGKCQTLTIILHAFAGGVFTTTPFATIVKVCLVSTLVISFWCTIRAYRKTARHLQAAQLRADDSWVLLIKNEQPRMAEIARPVFVTRRLMLFSLRDQRGGFWSLFIAADNAPEQTLRRLYVRLKYPSAKHA